MPYLSYGFRNFYHLDNLKTASSEMFTIGVTSNIFFQSCVFIRFCNGLVNSGPAVSLKKAVADFIPRSFR